MNMIRISFIWQKLGSIHLTVILCLLLSTDLACGYVCLNRRSPIFAPLNDIGLMAWIDTYGRHNMVYTAWFFALLGLLALLCINTFVCTTDRVVVLIRSRSHFGRQRFVFKFAPHVMHYALITILAGYLCSYLFARVFPGHTLVPGASMTLPGTAARITFESFDPLYYHGNRLGFFDNWVIEPRARLLFTDGDIRKTAVLTHNRPVRFKDYGIFLKDFSPRKKGGMGLRVSIQMSIRKDPGVRVYLAGMLLFTAGLALYVWEWIFLKKLKKEMS